MNNLERLRGKHGYSQTQLGKAINSTSQNIHYLEKRMNVVAAQKIEHILNENLFLLMGTDILKMLPRNKEDKENLLRVIESIEV